MADTNPTATGSSSSEYKLTLVVVIVGTILDGVGAVLSQLQGAGVAAPWIPAVLTVVGVLLQIASVLGYQSARAAVKTALISAQTQGLTAAQAAVPKTAAELVNAK